MKGNLSIIPFKTEHGLMMTRGIMNDPTVQIDKSWEEHLHNLEQPGKAFTAVYNGNCIVAGGITLLWEGVYEGWVIASHKIWDHPLAAARAVKKGLELLIEQNKVVRLQTAVKQDFKLGHRFAQWLGLKNEGTMKKYVSNQDHIRYARIIEWDYQQ